MSPLTLHAVSVLIVDDDRETSDLMAHLLGKAGYSVTLAGNGQEALGLLRWVRPALILLDLRMPVMDGEHFRAAQRCNRMWIAIPTIVMTADPHAERVLDMAVAGTILKPFALVDLMLAVGRHCGPGGRQRPLGGVISGH